MLLRGGQLALSREAAPQVPRVDLVRVLHRKSEGGGERYMVTGCDRSGCDAGCKSDCIVEYFHGEHAAVEWRAT